MRRLTAAIVIVLGLAADLVAAAPSRPARPKGQRSTRARPTAPARPAAPAPQPTTAQPSSTTAVLPAKEAAAPDVRKTLAKVVLRKRPGEKQAAVTTLPAGAEVIVDGEDGRWLRVRAGKAVGYLARTTVSEPPAAAPAAGAEPPVAAGAPAPAPAAPAESPARTHAWSAARRTDPAPSAGGELFVEVAAESAALRESARPEAASVARVARGSRLAVLEVSGDGWVRARDAAGATGWIARAEVGNGSAAAAIEADAGAPGAPAVSRAAAPAGGPGPARARLAVRVDAGVGYRTLGMDFRSNGAGGLANYLVTAGAGAAHAALDAAAPLGRLRLGADARLQLSRSSPGIDYTGPTSAPGTIPFQTFGVDAGVRAGAPVGRLFVLWARAGGHYDAFLSTDVENAGRLPRERLLGATAGARADIAPPGSRIRATLWADALVVGARRQTPGLEDGADSSVRAVWAGATLRVLLGRRLSILGAYDFGRVTTRWSGMSVREPGVTSARRTDGNQLIQIGVGAALW